MFESAIALAERHWLAFTLAIPIGIYAAWIASMVIPEVVKTVVPAVVRAVTGS